MKRLFVLGSGISYSLSPKIFAELFEIFGEKAAYGIEDISPADLDKIPTIAKGTVGFNVTKPFKEKIVRFLRADLGGIGSVNTVKADTMEGFSTDGDGLMFDLERNFGAVRGPLLVVGYGGAAKSCVHALLKAGHEVSVTGRDPVKARAFAGKMGISVYDGGELDGVISCVSGTFVPKVPEVRFCYDIRYDTPDTLKIGKYNCNGLGMLVSQAIFSYGIFFDKEFDKADTESVYCKLMEAL